MTRSHYIIARRNISPNYFVLCWRGLNSEGVRMSNDFSSKVRFEHFVESPIWSLCRNSPIKWSLRWKSNLITSSKFSNKVITLSKFKFDHFVKKFHKAYHYFWSSLRFRQIENRQVTFPPQFNLFFREIT